LPRCVTQSSVVLDFCSRGNSKSNNNNDDDDDDDDDNNDDDDDDIQNEAANKTNNAKVYRLHTHY